MVCRSCGKVRDLTADFPTLEVPAGAAQGFDVSSAEVIFRGLCDTCQNTGTPRSPQSPPPT
jgi:Fe2+ or Zn2+ uptake regulation protein